MKNSGKPLSYTLARDFRLNKYKYLMILPVLAFFITFAYLPMYGLIIAFQDFRVHLGISGSRWVGFRHFEAFFNDPFFFRLLRNTFSISILSIIFGFPAPIILAILLNEVRNTVFKRTVQTITYMPFFISMVVVCSLIVNFSSVNGIFSQISVFFGGEPRNFLMHPQYFYPIFVLSGIWETIGWNSIIFLAALASIDQEQYEAAYIDGAGRFRRIWSITLPNLFPIIMVLFILRMGGILNVGFEKIILLYNPNTFQVADVISTFVYRRGIHGGAFSFATAVGLFNSVVNVFFLVIANTLSRKFSENSLF